MITEDDLDRRLSAAETHTQLTQPADPDLLVCLHRARHDTTHHPRAALRPLAAAGGIIAAAAASTVLISAHHTSHSPAGTSPTPSSAASDTRVRSETAVPDRSDQARAAAAAAAALNAARAAHLTQIADRLTAHYGDPDAAAYAVLTTTTKVRPVLPLAGASPERIWLLRLDGHFTLKGHTTDHIIVAIDAASPHHILAATDITRPLDIGAFGEAVVTVLQ